VLVVLTKPQPQAPNLLGATGTGPLARRCPLGPMKRSNQAGARHGPWRRWKSQNQAGAGRGPFGPMEGRTQPLAQNMVRWIDRKGQTARSPGFGRWLGF